MCCSVALCFMIQFSSMSWVRLVWISKSLCLLYSLSHYLDVLLLMLLCILNTDDENSLFAYQAVQYFCVSNTFIAHSFQTVWVLFSSFLLLWCCFSRLYCKIKEVWEIFAILPNCCQATSCVKTCLQSFSFHFQRVKDLFGSIIKNTFLYIEFIKCSPLCLVYGKWTQIVWMLSWLTKLFSCERTFFRYSLETTYKCINPFLPLIIFCTP